jgi:hypothetical protein
MAAVVMTTAAGCFFVLTGSAAAAARTRAFLFALHNAAYRKRHKEHKDNADDNGRKVLGQKVCHKNASF